MKLLRSYLSRRRCILLGCAMPWIESHSVIGRHRKFKGLARQLKISIPQAIGHMHILWHNAIEQAEDGDLSSWTVGAIAESASWEGSEEEFLKATQDNQLMDGQKIHDWLDYAGKYLTSKYKTSNPDRLHLIWAKFDKTYGKEVNRNSLELPKVSLKAPHITLPNLPNNTNQRTIVPRGTEKKSSATQQFQKPTFDDVQSYCAERGNGIKPQAFLAFYESNGWRVGKNPMKNWKAAVVTWENKERSR